MKHVYVTKGLIIVVNVNLIAHWHPLGVLYIHQGPTLIFFIHSFFIFFDMQNSYSSVFPNPNFKIRKHNKFQYARGKFEYLSANFFPVFGTLYCLY